MAEVTESAIRKVLETVIDPASGLDKVCDVALAAGRIVGIGRVPPDFAPHRSIDATDCLVLPGLALAALDLRHGRIEGAQQERLLQIDRELSSLTDRRAKLVDLFERTGQVSTDLSGPPKTPEEQKLLDAFFAK